jgi:hypothetical protein
MPGHQPYGAAYAQTQEPEEIMLAMDAFSQDAQPTPQNSVYSDNPWGMDIPVQMQPNGTDDAPLIQPSSMMNAM